MIDHAGHRMANGKAIAVERIQGINDNMVKSHYHDYYEIYFLEYGKRYHVLDQEIYCVDAKEFIVFPPHVMHFSYSEQDTPFKRLILYFDPTAIHIPEIAQKLSLSVGVYKPSDKISQEIHLLINQILKEQEQEALFHEETEMMLLNQLLVKIIRCKEDRSVFEKNSRIRDIVRYIHEHYTENITLEFLSETFYISKYHLCREFKHYTHTTLVTYVNRLRIAHAIRLLLETDLSVSAIARIIGFSTGTHFSRIFKLLHQQSPSHWRRENINRYLPTDQSALHETLSKQL